MTTIAKKELLKWLENEEDIDYLNEVQKIKMKSEEQKNNFYLRVENGLSLEEFRHEMHKRIKSWDWKK